MKRPVVTIIGLGVVGGSYAGALSAAGYTVYGVARTSDTLEKAKRRGMIADGGTDAAPFAAKSDVVVIALYPGQVAAELRALAPHLRPGTIVTDVAGIKSLIQKEVEEALPEGVEFVFALNWLGTLLPTQVFAGDMIERNGNILNIASMNAYTPLTKIPAYSGAKAAIVNFTQWLATYFAKSGIRVNAIAPGFFVGNQNRGLLFNEDGTPTARTAKILAGTPMGRFGELEELAGAVLFLINNDAAGFITGVCIPIDGGYSAYSGV